MTIPEIIEDMETKSGKDEWFPTFFVYEYILDTIDGADRFKTGWAVVNNQGVEDWIGNAVKVIKEYLANIYDEDSFMLIGVRFVPDWVEGVYLHSA